MQPLFTAEFFGGAFEEGASLAELPLLQQLDAGLNQGLFAFGLGFLRGFLRVFRFLLQDAGKSVQHGGNGLRLGMLELDLARASRILRIKQVLQGLMAHQGMQEVIHLDFHFRAGRAHQFDAGVLAHGRGHGVQGALDFFPPQITIGAGDIFTQFFGWRCQHACVPLSASV